MSIILPFPHTQVPRRRPPLETHEKSGQILFFTGVRIERDVEQDTLDSHPQRGGNSTGKRRRKA